MTHIKHLRKIVPDLDTRNILDVGCGKGNFLLECPSATGIEINPDKVLEARGRGVQSVIVLGSALDTPFKDGEFDFLNISEVIEHVPEPKKFLAEMWRILQLHGLAYISVPCRYGIFDPHYKLLFINWLPRKTADWVIKILGKNKQKAIDLQLLSEMNYFTFNEFVKICPFSVEDIREKKMSRYGIFATTLYKLVRPWCFTTHHLLLSKI